MARCPHNNIQQFTEICLDCGRNIYESDDSYYSYLINRLNQKQKVERSYEIELMEKHDKVQGIG